MKIISLLKFKLTFFCFFALGDSTDAQNTISGTIKDLKTNVPIVGANVIIKNTDTGGTTNENGKFTITSAQAFPWTVVVSYTGYTSQEAVVRSSSDFLNLAISENSTLIDEMVVSASRRAEKIQESPSAISVISAKKLQMDNVGNPMLSLRNVTGVDIAQTGVTNGQINLRGRGAAFNTETFVIADYRNIVLPSLGIVQYGQQPIDPVDLEKIEVVKGTGGALYGPGVEAGIVHFISKSAFKEQGTTVSLGVGTQNQLQGSFRHAGVNKNGKLGYKLTGFYRTATDFENDTITDRVSAARIAAHPKQIKSSVDGNVILDNAQLDYTNKSMSIMGSVEYKFTPRTTLTTVVGTGRAQSLFKTGQGDGYVKAWRPFAQARLQAGRFFAQTVWSKQLGGDGEAWLYTSGLTTVNEVTQLEGQAQYEISAANNKLTIVTGADYRLNTIDTKGSINGRFEDKDDYLIAGAYAQAKYAISPKLDIIGAARLDRFQALKQNAFSPRLGMVFKAHENHAIRATWNHAVGAATSLQLSNDFVLANTGTFLAWLHGGSEPMTFTQNRYYSFITQQTSNSPDLAARVAYGAATAGLAGKVPAPLLAYLQRVTPRISGTIQGSLASQPQSRGVIGLSTSDMYEIGYIGKINNKFNVTVDVYYNKRDNNLTAGQQAGSLVIYPTAGTDIATIVGATIPADSAARFGMTPAQIAGLYKQAIESLTLNATTKQPSPLGLLSSDQSPTGKTLDLTYFNVEAIDYWGADFGINYSINANLDIFANYSHLSQVYWEKAQVKGTTTTVPFALNQPGDRLRIGFDYICEKGLLLNAAVRYSAPWKAVNGVWSGDIPAVTVVDASMGYAFSPKMRLNITATNLFDAKNIVLMNAPNIGRLILAKGTISF